MNDTDRFPLLTDLCAGISRDPHDYRHFSIRLHAETQRIDIEYPVQTTQGPWWLSMPEKSLGFNPLAVLNEDLIERLTGRACVIFSDRTSGHQAIQVLGYLVDLFRARRSILLKFGFFGFSVSFDSACQEVRMRLGTNYRLPIEQYVTQRESFSHYQDRLRRLYRSSDLTPNRKPL